MTKTKFIKFAKEFIQITYNPLIFFYTFQNK